MTFHEFYSLPLREIHRYIKEAELLSVHSGKGAFTSPHYWAIQYRDHLQPYERREKEVLCG